MIRITNLSEGQEDCFLLQVCKKNSLKVNILVDGGRSKIRCMNMLERCEFDQLDYAILTHIDSDHIQGLIGIFESSSEKYRDTIIVYNKFINGMISYRQAENFEKIINKREIIVSYKEYQTNTGEISFMSVCQRKKLRKEKDKIYITFLAPSKEAIENLIDAYRVCKEFKKNKTNNAEIVNGSSIMFLLEYENSAILMLGDGYISDIISSMKLLANAEDTYEPIKEINLIKLSHHGSEKNNIELDSLLTIISCKKFLLTNSEKGSVKLEEKLRNQLQGKVVYSTNSVIDI